MQQTYQLNDLPSFTVNATHLWRFSDTFCEARRAALSSVGRFCEVIDLIAGSIESIQVEVCPGRSEGLEAYVQPVFTLSVSPEAFDTFFNSPAGYRACYLHDPHLGLAPTLRSSNHLLSSYTQRQCKSRSRNSHLLTSRHRSLRRRARSGCTKRISHFNR